MMNQVQTFCTAGFDASETARRCIDLIARRAPTLMVGTGVGIEGEGSSENVGRRLADEVKEQVVALRRRGWRYKQIAAHLAISEPSARKYCRLAGCGGADVPVRRVKRERSEEIRRRRAAGQTVHQIEREMGIGKTTAHRHATAG